MMRVTLLQLRVRGQYPFSQLNPVADPDEAIRRSTAIPRLIENKRLYSNLFQVPAGFDPVFDKVADLKSGEDVNLGIR
jgi:hypothetical protein